MKNSTTLNLRSKSINLENISPRSEFRTNPLQTTNFINHDYDNLYRSSYNDMSNKVK